MQYEKLHELTITGFIITRELRLIVNTQILHTVWRAVAIIGPRNPTNPSQGHFSVSEETIDDPGDLDDGGEG